MGPEVMKISNLLYWDHGELDPDRPKVSEAEGSESEEDAKRIV